MRMKGILGALAAVAFNRAMPVHHVPANSKTGRQLRARTGSSATTLRRAQRLPHLGEKEQDRALRYYMEPNYPNGNPRSAPVVQQISKKQYRAMVEQAETRRLDEASWV